MLFLKFPDAIDRILIRLFHWRSGAISTSLQVVPQDYFWFQEWRKIQEWGGEVIDVSPRSDRDIPHGKSSKGWVKELLLNEKTVLDLEFSGHWPVVEADDIQSAKAKIRNIRFEQNSGNKPILNKRFDIVVASYRARVQLERCWVRELKTQDNVQLLDLKDTWIEHLILGGSVGSISISGGGILEVGSPGTELEFAL